VENIRGVVHACPLLLYRMLDVSVLLIEHRSQDQDRTRLHEVLSRVLNIQRVQELAWLTEAWFAGRMDTWTALESKLSDSLPNRLRLHLCALIEHLFQREEEMRDHLEESDSPMVRCVRACLTESQNSRTGADAQTDVEVEVDENEVLLALLRLSPATALLSSSACDRWNRDIAPRVRAALLLSRPGALLLNSMCARLSTAEEVVHCVSELFCGDDALSKVGVCVSE
jgi:hypothetical protein